jgi:hypothetical protein
MKKAEIKRRKRVVPANIQQQQPHDQNSPNASDMMEEDSSLQSEPQPSTIQTIPRGPIPVDFTDSYRHAHPQPMEIDEHPRGLPSVPHKRSFSMSTRDDKQPYAHAQNADPRQVRRDENIDPSLPSGEDPASSGLKEARRAELQREAERFRRMLEEKERELAELG